MPQSVNYQDTCIGHRNVTNFKINYNKSSILQLDELASIYQDNYIILDQIYKMFIIELFQLATRSDTMTT